MKQLFKYTSQPQRILENGYIRATQVSALNDPFEATYCVDGLRELANHFDGLTADSVIEYVDLFRSHVGVICLTEAKDNLLMWSHYADEHRGGLVGIFVDHPYVGIFEALFPFGESTGLSMANFDLFTGRCLPVQYRKQPRYRIDRFDFDYSNIDGEGEDRLLFEIFQQKSDEWIYEKEHRITLRLEQADLVEVVDLHLLKNKSLIDKIRNLNSYSEEFKGGETISKIDLSEVDPKWRGVYSGALAKLALNPRNLYLFKLNQSAISSVVLGHKSEFEVNSHISSYASSIGMFSSVRASLDKGSYSLQIPSLD